MAANPITWTEIDAYNRATHALLTAWDARLIHRIDDAVLKVAAGSKGGGEVSAKHGAAVSALFRGFSRKPKGAADDRNG